MKLSGGGATAPACGAAPPPTATVAGVKLKPAPEPGWLAAGVEVAGLLPAAAARVVNAGLLPPH